MERESVRERESVQVLIVGAGPAGLSVGIEAKRSNLSYIILERGTVANSVLRYPLGMKFFSTPELLEIGGIPFSTPHDHPTRDEGLTYYRKVTDHFDLRIALGEEVLEGERTEEGWIVRTSKRELVARSIVIASGYFDNPNVMGIPGEDLPNVSHYYSEGHPFYSRDVTVIGSQNSAAEAALDLLNHKARVTMIVRASKFGESVKYWLKPNLENRVKAGAIKVHFDSEVKEIQSDQARIENKTGENIWIESDQVFALTGYRPDISFLSKFGIVADPMTMIPQYNADTFETNIPGVFIAGSVACGCETGTIFIENGRLHAFTIIGVIKRRLGEQRKTRLVE